MNRRFYLSKVKIYVEQEEYGRPFPALEQELAAGGIRLERCGGPFIIPGLRGAEQTGCIGQENTPGSAKTVDKLPSGDGELWITDSRDFALALAEAGIPFAVYLHPGNRDKDFSMARYGVEDLEDTDVSYLEGVYRRFAGLPWDILETERCLVRETTEADVDAFYRIYSEPAVTRFTEGLYPQVEQEKEYVREYREKIYNFYNYGVWTVVLRENGDIIGRAGFSCRPGFDAPELGFVIGLPWQGKGLAGEVCGAILGYGEEELGFTRVQALSEPENLASLSLLKRLGFERHGCMEENGKEYILLIREKKGTE